MTEKRERRITQTVDLLHAWAGIGMFARLLFAIAIIAACVWFIANAFAMVVWINSLLTGRIES